jgi:DNA-binding transcriptional MocR family regulator
MIDFKFNYPSISEEKEALQQFLGSRSTEALQQALTIPSFQGKIESTEQLGKLLQLDWNTITATSELVLCTSANQALSCLLQGLRSAHSTIVAEAFMYATFKSIALNNQYQVLTVPMDQEGYIIEELRETITTTKSRLLYVQPTIHNPTCAVMSLERREQIVSLAQENDLLIIEDDAYRFLHPDPPPTFLQLAPERTVHIYSLSKPFNPLIKTTFVILPKHLKEMMVDQVRFTSSGTSALLCQLADYLLDAGALESFIAKKRALAQERQSFAVPFLEGLTYQTYPTSFHIWLTLPAATSATAVTTALSKQGLQIVSGTDCSFTAKGERYIRIAFGAEGNKDRLEKGLYLLRKAISSYY